MHFAKFFGRIWFLTGGGCFTTNLTLSCPTTIRLCVDNCSCCGYRRTNRNIERIDLNDEYFRCDLELLLSWGYRIFDFVYATDLHYTPAVIS